MTYESTGSPILLSNNGPTTRKAKSTDGAAIINLLNTIVGEFSQFEACFNR